MLSLLNFFFYVFGNFSCSGKQQVLQVPSFSFTYSAFDVLPREEKQ